MLIEIHMLQNHAPSNLNRDDTGSPKECVFGGVKRARISSQCLKRSIRHSKVLESEYSQLSFAQRTRQLPELVRKKLLAAGLAEDLADVAALKATGFGTKDGKEREKEGNTAQTMLLTERDVNAVADVLMNAARNAGTAEKFKKIEAKKLQADPALAGWRSLTTDVSLFGRMITSSAFQNVDGAMQVAHAISTHKVDHEFDYFTAVDDLRDNKNAADEETEQGADMIGDVEFNSACYYKYFSLDMNALIANLAGPECDDKALKATKEAALQTVQGFIKAAVFTTPTGKQNTFAAHQLPDVVFVEVRSTPTPISYSNAFVMPARARQNHDLIDDSITRFIAHVDLLKEKFSLNAEPRLWFSTRDSAPAAVTCCSTLDALLGDLQQITGV